MPEPFETKKDEITNSGETVETTDILIQPENFDQNEKTDQELIEDFKNSANYDPNIINEPNGEAALLQQAKLYAEWKEEKKSFWDLTFEQQRRKIRESNDNLKPGAFFDSCEAIFNGEDANENLQSLLAEMRGKLSDTDNNLLAEVWENSFSAFNKENGLDKRITVNDTAIREQRDQEKINQYAIYQCIYDYDEIFSWGKKIIFNNQHYQPLDSSMDEVREKIEAKLWLKEEEEEENTHQEKITLEKYNGDYGTLYQDIIKNTNNLSPESFSEICKEIAKIPEQNIKNALFERITRHIANKRDNSFTDWSNKKLNDEWSKIYQKIHREVYEIQAPTEQEQKLIEIYNCLGGKQDRTIIIHGTVFQRSSLLSDFQLEQVINKETVTDTPTSLKELMEVQQKREEKAKLAEEKRARIAREKPQYQTVQDKIQNKINSTDNSNSWWAQSMQNAPRENIFKINPSFQQLLSNEWIEKPTIEQETQRQQEGKILSVYENLNGLLSKEEIEACMKTNEIRTSLEDLLRQKGKTKEEIWSILANARPDPERVQEYIDSQHAKIGEKRRSIVGGVDNVFQTINEYLNTQTKEGINFSEIFNIDTRNNVEITPDNKIIMKGFLKNSEQHNTPQTFSYDMNTWILSTNSILWYDKARWTFSINNAQGDMPLFSLPDFATLKDNNKEKKADISIEPFKREVMELNIEKNKTIEYIIHSFNLDSKPQYDKNNPGIYHMLQLIDNSLNTPEECRNLRQNIWQLDEIMWKEDIASHPGIESEEVEIHHDKEEIQDNINDNKLHKKGWFLFWLFNSKKRIEDQKDIKGNIDKDNGVYNFLKCFTGNIGTYEVHDSSFNEHQKINIADMNNYLSLVQQWKEKEYNGPAQQKIRAIENKFLLSWEEGVNARDIAAQESLVALNNVADSWTNIDGKNIHRWNAYT